MNLEEIFTHFKIPENKELKTITNYSNDTIKRFKKQKKLLITKTKKIVDYMLKQRDLIAKHVFNFDDNINIHIPVNFYRIINNVQNNLHITSNNIVDITPIEYYALIEKKFAKPSKNILRLRNYSK